MFRWECFSAAGVDSSAVAALMTKLRRAPVETFSVGYAEDQYSELPYARVVAEHLNSIHHEVLVSREEFFEALPQLIWHEDEPIAWPSSVPLYFVARAGAGAGEGGAHRRRQRRNPRRLRALCIHIEECCRSTAITADWCQVRVRRQIRNAIQDSSWISAPLRRKLAHTPLARDGNSWASFYFDNFLCAFSEKEQHVFIVR